MKTLTVSFGRRTILAAGFALVAGVAAFVAMAQDNQGQLPFGHLNNLGQDGTMVNAPQPTTTPGMPTGNVTGALKQVEFAADSLQIVSITGGVAFWDPIKRLLYVYPADFSQCSGIYSMTAPGQPMTRVGP